MVRFLSSAMALPEHVVLQADMREAMRRWFEPDVPNVDRVLGLFDRSGVERRHLVVPLEELFEPRSFGDRNRVYAEHSVALSLRVARDALARANLAPDAIDLITTVSCTGIMIPAVDAYLANELPLKREIRRLPITELGCAAGAMGLAHTMDYLRANPTHCALVIAVEIASLNFQPGDLSMPHLVSCALFGDGAVAVIVAGEDAPVEPTRGPRFLHRETYFIHDTIDAMGFRVEDTGFHMVLDADLTGLLHEHLPGALSQLADAAGIEVSDIDHYLVHPGGRKILDMLEELLGRGPDAVRHSRRVLGRYGNLSSASIFALLHEFEQEGAAAPGDRGVLVAFGPGFNAETILLEWPRC